MTRDREKFVFDVFESSRYLAQFTADETLDRYVNDRAFRRVIERELQIIGEALMQLKKLDPKVVARFSESERIIAFRHVLVHGYHELDGGLVWNILKQKLPALQRELEVLLGPNDGSVPPVTP